jgi:aspartate/methionine/tyrosine aminotransferase
MWLVNFNACLMNSNFYDLSLGTIDPAYVPGHSSKLATAYSPPGGLMALRRLLAHVEQVEAANIVVTHGASMALSCIFLALEKHNYPVLIPQPYFPAYANVLRMIGRDFVTYDVSDASGIAESIENAMKRQPISAILVNSPGNPLGNVIPDNTIERVLEMAEKQDCWLILDQTYAGLDFTRPGDTGKLTGLRPGLIRIGSFSKRFACPGHRLGYVTGDASILDRLSTIHWGLAMSANTTAQIDACDILMACIKNPNRIRNTVAALESACDRALRQLSLHGLNVAKPQGGAMLWLSFEGCAGKGADIAAYCREKTGIIVSPGESFGITDMPAIRCSFAIDPECVAVTFDRLGTALAEWVRQNRKSSFCVKDSALC